MDPELKAILHTLLNDFQTASGYCDSMSRAMKKMVSSIEILAKKLDEPQG